MNWKNVWAVFNGESLDGAKALNRNAGIGLFLIGIMVLNMIRAGKVNVKEMAALILLTALFFCYSWLVARNDEAKRNKLLVVQGVLAIPLIIAAAVWLIVTLYAIAHPVPGNERAVSRMGYAPGLVLTAIFYFGRHISDFSHNIKLRIKKYSMILLAIGIPFEVVLLVNFFQAVSVMFARVGG